MASSFSSAPPESPMDTNSISNTSNHSNNNSNSNSNSNHINPMSGNDHPTPIVSNLRTSSTTSTIVAAAVEEDLLPTPPLLKSQRAVAAADGLLGTLPDDATQETGEPEPSTAAATTTPSSYFSWFNSSSSSATNNPPVAPPPAAEADATPTSETDPTTETPIAVETSPMTEAVVSSSTSLVPNENKVDEEPLADAPEPLSVETQQKPPLGAVADGVHTLLSLEEIPSDPSSSVVVSPTSMSASSVVGRQPSASSLTRIHPDTPVPHARTCVRLLRQFACKTRPRIAKAYGGRIPRSLLSYVVGPSTKNQRDEKSTFGPYATLMACLYLEGESQTDDDEDEETAATNAVTVPIAVAAVDPVVQARADLALVAFVEVVSVWGHASSALLEKKDKAGQTSFAVLQVAALDAAHTLAAHGCLDNVQITMSASSVAAAALTTPRVDEAVDGEEKSIMEYHSAAQMLATSVFNSDLSLEQVELAAMKFLLGAGCCQDPTLLRGSYLLQSIRTLYHVFLTTESKSNKVTARAALQQLVTSVFTKVVRTTTLSASDSLASGNAKQDVFPSENHRDAFLVLRSICKLSMRQLPDDNGGGHIGLQTSASNDTWDGDRVQSSSERGGWGGNSNSGLGGSNRPTTTAHLVATGAIHPALESKVLALELILYVLQKTTFTVDFLQNCGPQFHAAIRNYLCVSLLKNCTSDNTSVVSLSLRIFVPVVRNFRTVLKTEIEAFVTNVFFVILDSKNSPAEHKSIVVNTFNEICSDPSTLAEIFLNYDCDLSAVDLFHRIVNTLSRLSRNGLQEPLRSMTSSFMGGPTEAQMEKSRSESRELRLDAMRALRQILASLHASIVEPMDADQKQPLQGLMRGEGEETNSTQIESLRSGDATSSSPESPSKQSLVEIYGSKKKRRAEESEAVLRFNQKPSAGIAYAAKCNHIDAEDPVDVARYLLKNKDEFEKSMIGEYLGREVEYQNGFSMRVLHEYVRLMDFTDLVFDDAIRFFLSGFRLPGEAQKIDRIMEKFAERFTEQNASVFPTADAAFILSFSIIMLNTDLHNPAIKEERRMTRDGFVRNNRGICDGQDLPEELLTGIFDRIKQNPISLKEDEEARERIVDTKKSLVSGLPAALNPASFFSSHYDDMDRARETNFQKERDHIVRTTESLLKRRRHTAETRSPARARSMKAIRGVSRFVLSGDSGLRDEYVSPMFEVTWGPALASFSTAMESANGTVGALISIASDEELELAAENAAETIEVCLTGFRFAIGIAGLCGNSIARDAYMLGLSRFSQLGTGVLLEPRHIRCVQTMFSLAREDGELLGGAWEHVFKALSEVNRFHQVFQLMARNDRVAALAAERRRHVLEAMEQKRDAREQRKAAAEDGESISDLGENVFSESDDDDSLTQLDLFEDDDKYVFDDNMDAKAIDESNAREIYEAVSEATIEAIYERSSSLSAYAVQEFVVQLCLVSRSEISVGVNSRSDDLNQVTYRQKHALLNGTSNDHTPGDQFHHTQPNIYNLQKLVEVTHYNMASRPRLLFSEIWVTVADHLTDTALHSNPAIAMYAVDSFRQLSIQYLQRDELEVFEFQRRFLKPLETVMALSKQTSTKELLLNCVARLIHVFGTNADSSATSSPRKGGLKSGWVPILNILGIGGRDNDEGIAQVSFTTLSDEIKLCFHQRHSHDVLLTEHFVETVDALLMIAGGPHDAICILALNQLVALTDALADGAISLPQIKRKSTLVHLQETLNEDDAKRHLELWWPILLGLSRALGDTRLEIRARSLDALFGMINKYFFPTGPVDDKSDSWEIIQLIFRGVLSSVLDFSETSCDNEPTPSLPDDFERLITDVVDERKNKGLDDSQRDASWLETTFEPFMDACVDICLRSMAVSKDSLLVEEVFAILNSCLLSDSGTLAVRGLRRLEQFVTSDLDVASLSDDVWATVSHMLQRCLTVRNLPKRELKPDEDEQSAIEKETEYSQAVDQFLAEDRYLAHRRYMGSNATMVVGLLLCSDRFSIGLRWRLFLVKWLHRAIREWDSATVILSKQDAASSSKLLDYRDTAFYGRKWINRLVLQLAAMIEIVQAPPNSDPKVNRFAQGQKQVIEVTEELMLTFVQKEEIALAYRHTELDELVHKRATALVQELLSGYGDMDDANLKEMSWISPVLLSSCIRSKNEDVRLMVQKLVSRTSPATASSPYPAPVVPSLEANAKDETAIDSAIAAAESIES